MKSTIDPSTLEPRWEQTTDTTWIVQLEKDPETGELVMPIPQELLEAQGWSIGDVLTWEFTDNGSATLRKK
jgi:hypothetical protein